MSETDDIELQARYQLHDRWMQVEYRARNRSAGPLFVFNILHGDFHDGVFPLDRSAYVEIAEHDVIVSRKLFPVPPLMMVETRNIPFLTRLAPGEWLTEQFHLNLPLIPHNPYVAATSAGATVADRDLIVEIGYFPAAPGSAGLGRMFPTDMGPRPGFDVFSEDRQRLARTAPLGRVPVLVDAATAGE